MKYIIKKLVLVFVLMQILIQCTIVECKPKPKNGKGKAFGAGVLAGGLAGAAISHVFTRHNYPSAGVPASAPAPAPQVRPSTVIERGETLPNGCYKQTIKEPDAYDVQRFIETEQLICPPSLPAPPASIQEAQPIVPAIHIIAVQPVVPIQPAPPAAPAAPAAPIANSHPTAPEQLQPIPQLPNIHDPSQFPPLVPVYTAPLAPLMPVSQFQHPANEAPSPVVPIVTQPQPAIVQPQQPANPVPVPASTSVNSQVIVLSKKAGFYADTKKRNHANILLTTNYVVMSFLIVFINLM